MPKHIRIPPMRETALGLFMSEPPTPAGEFRKEVNMLTETTPATELPAEKEFQCPDCDRTFAKAQGLGAHRSRVHGYRNPKPHPTSKNTQFPPSMIDALLADVFPTGIPADRESVEAVHEFILAYERLVAVAQ